MEPFYQGALDSLCGVYSIVNAVRKVTKNIDSQDKFAEIITYLDSKKDLCNIIIHEGVSRQILSGIFNEVIGDKVKVHSPFWKKPDTDLETFWNEMINFLDNEDKHAILICLGGRIWDHWSVVDSITNNQIRFFDSDSLKRLNRNRCTTQKETKARPHILLPTHTYFISGKKKIT